jgi:hypothetical protein
MGASVAVGQTVNPPPALDDGEAAAVGDDEGVGDTGEAVETLVSTDGVDVLAAGPFPHPSNKPETSNPIPKVPRIANSSLTPSVRAGPRSKGRYHPTVLPAVVPELVANAVQRRCDRSR